MIYLVDNTIDGEGASPREIRETLERIRPDVPVHTEHYKNVSLPRLESLSPTHIILSGQSHPWDNYTPESLAGVFDVIRHAPQPLLGICGGHQQIALCYGAPVDVIKRLEPDTTGYNGCLRQRGFHDIQTNGQDIFNGLPPIISVWQSHYDEVKQLPESFIQTATNETSPLQAMQHRERPLYSVQFHPELFDNKHPHGQRILENFLNL